MVGVGESARTPGVGRPASAAEWRSHFGAWVVNSSPLVLSFDLLNATVMDVVWPFITNIEAIAVNQAWAGHPGGALPLAASSTNATASTTGPTTSVSGGASGDARAWAKPLSGGRVAVVLVNMRAAGAIDVDLGVPAASWLPPLPRDAAVRDVWARKGAGAAVAGKFAVRGLAAHDSRFLIFSPA